MHFVPLKSIGLERFTPTDIPTTSFLRKLLLCCKNLSLSYHASFNKMSCSKTLAIALLFISYLFSSLCFRPWQCCSPTLSSWPRPYFFVLFWSRWLHQPLFTVTFKLRHWVCVTLFLLLWIQPVYHSYACEVFSAPENFSSSITLNGCQNLSSRNSQCMCVMLGQSCKSQAPSKGKITGSYLCLNYIFTERWPNLIQTQT